MAVGAIAQLIPEDGATLEIRTITNRPIKAKRREAVLNVAKKATIKLIVPKQVY